MGRGTRGTRLVADFRLNHRRDALRCFDIGVDSRDYLRLLPKTELHFHFVSTMSAAHLISLADREGVSLPTTDPE